jgi:hypothetical protein
MRSAARRWLKGGWLGSGVRPQFCDGDAGMIGEHLLDALRLRSLVSHPISKDVRDEANGARDLGSDSPESQTVLVH